LFYGARVIDDANAAEPKPAESLEALTGQLRLELRAVTAEDLWSRVLLFFVRFYLDRLLGQFETLLTLAAEGKLQPAPTPVDRAPADRAAANRAAATLVGWGELFPSSHLAPCWPWSVAADQQTSPDSNVTDADAGRNEPHVIAGLDPGIARQHAAPAAGPIAACTPAKPSIAVVRFASAGRNSDIRPARHTTTPVLHGKLGGCCISPASRSRFPKQPQNRSAFVCPFRYDTIIMSMRLCA
jgi:hypothetical protein